MCKAGITKLADNNQHQIDEALGDDNRYFASQFYQEEITDEGKLVMYYIIHGGAEGHRKRVEESKKQNKRENM